MILMKLDLLDGLGLIEVVVKDGVVADRLRRFGQDVDEAFSDRDRWMKIRSLMTHEQSGPKVGWCLSTLLPGEDPDDAIDRAEVTL